MKVIDLFEEISGGDKELLNSFLTASIEEQKKFISDNVSGPYSISTFNLSALWYELRELPTQRLSNDIMEYIINVNPVFIYNLIYDNGNKLPPEYLIYKALDKNGCVISSIVTHMNKNKHGLLQKYILYVAINQGLDYISYSSIRGVLHEDPSMIKKILTDVNILTNTRKRDYDNFVKELFPTSSLLVNKWIRFGDRLRGRINESN